MLEIVIPEQHLFDNDKGEFIDVKETKLKLEHSLLSLKKWEAKWHKPFLSDDEKSLSEMIDYIFCMSLNRDIDPNVRFGINVNIIEKVTEYIKDPMTATTFSRKGLIGAQRHSNEIITAEIIYYWMVSLRIPVEFEKWHLNQLLTLIRVVNIKNGGEKKMDNKVWAQKRATLNAERRAKYNTKG